MPTNYFENGVQIVGALAFGAALKKSLSLMNNGDVLFVDRPDDPDLTKESIVWKADGSMTLAMPFTFTDKLTIALGTLTADKQALGVTATWNAAAVAFTLLKANVTDTASAAASVLVDLQVGGASKFKVDKAGVLTLGTALAVGQGGTGLSTIPADNVLFTSALNILTAAPITAFGRSLIDDAAAVNARTTLGLVIGTDVAAQSHVAASAAVHGLPASVNVLGNRDAAGEFIQRGTSGASFTTGADETRGRVTKAVTFAVAFSATPRIFTGNYTGVDVDIITAGTNPSTTGFTVLFYGVPSITYASSVSFLALGT